MKKMILLMLVFSIATIVKSQTAEEYLNMGLKKANNQDYKGFIADLDKAIALDPKYVIAYYNRGTAKILLKDYNGAIVDFNKAIEIEPLYTIAYTNRGNAKLYLENYIGAISDFSKAIEIDSLCLEAYQSRGTAKIELGQNESACLDFEKALSLGSPQAKWSINKYCKFYYNSSNTIYNDNKCSDSVLTKLLVSIQGNDLKNFTIALGTIKNINDTCKGYTPLMVACESYNINFAKILISKGSNIHIKTKLGTPLYLVDYTNYYGIDSAQLRFTEFFVKILLSSIEKNSQWIATKNHLPNVKEIRNAIVEALIERKRSSENVYNLIQLYDILIVDASKGEFIVECDVAILDKNVTQMLDVVNISGKSIPEPANIATHAVLCSDFSEGGAALLGFELEKAKKWTFIFSLDNDKKWNANIKETQP